MTTLFDKTICLKVQFRAPGTRRHGDLTDIDTDAQKTELALSKRIFDSETYQLNRRIRNQVKKWLERRSVPSPLSNGTYLIPVQLVDDVNRKLDEVRVEYDASADKFVEEYPALIDVWREKLGSQFNADDYPSPREMRRRFAMERMILNFSPARPGEIDQSAEIESAVNEIKAALRYGLLELVQRLSGMLEEGKDGKKKRISSSSVDQFNEWMELLPARLVVDDEELKAVADRARKLMTGKSVADLRDIEKVRSQTKTGLTKIAQRLEKLVRDVPSRAFGFDDE